MDDIYFDQWDISSPGSSCLPKSVFLYKSFDMCVREEGTLKAKLWYCMIYSRLWMKVAIKMENTKGKCCKY